MWSKLPWAQQTTIWQAAGTINGTELRVLAQETGLSQAKCAAHMPWMQQDRPPIPLRPGEAATTAQTNVAKTVKSKADAAKTAGYAVHNTLPLPLNGRSNLTFYLAV